MPVEMVQARELMEQLLLRRVDKPWLPPKESQRHIAQSDAFLPAAVLDNGLRDHSRRVGKVDQPGIRTQLLHILDNAKDHRDGAERLEHASRPVGLLSQHPVGQRDPLILDPGVQKAYPELSGNEIGARQRLSPVKSQIDLHIIGGSVPHALSHLAHDLQLLLPLLDVNQPDLPDGKLLIPLNKALH